MARIQSEYVVRYEDVFMTTEMVSGEQIYHLNIVMEYCPKGDLYSFISGLLKRRKEQVRLLWICQLSIITRIYCYPINILIFPI